MAGCYGNGMEDRYFANILDKHLDKGAQSDNRDAEIEQAALDKFKALPDFYRSTDGVKRYTNIEDLMNSIQQPGYIALARLLRDGDTNQAGIFLSSLLMDYCRQQAEDEYDEREDK